jgi:hypothetical protein
VNEPYEWPDDRFEIETPADKATRAEGWRDLALAGARLLVALSCPICAGLTVYCNVRWVEAKHNAAVLAAAVQRGDGVRIHRTTLFGGLPPGADPTALYALGTFGGRKFELRKRLGLPELGWRDYTHPDPAKNLCVAMWFVGGEPDARLREFVEAYERTPGAIEGE